MNSTITLLATTMLAAACASAQIPSLEVLYQFGRGPNEVTAPDTTLVEFKPGLFVGSYSQGLFSITSAGEFNVLSDFHNAA